MLKKSQPLAIYMEQSLGEAEGKMGHGIIRFSENPIACVIDSEHAGKSVSQIIDLDRDCPIVANLEQAKKLGAQVFVLGIAPSGGQIPDHWFPVIDSAVVLGSSIINGLHEYLTPARTPTRIFLDMVRLHHSIIGCKSASPP